MDGVAGGAEALDGVAAGTAALDGVAAGVEALDAGRAVAGGDPCSGDVLGPVAAGGPPAFEAAGGVEAAGGTAGAAGLCGPALGLSALFAAGAVLGGRSNAKTRGV